MNPKARQARRDCTRQYLCYSASTHQYICRDRWLV